MHTAEPLLPGPSYFQVEIATEKPERHKSPDTDQVLAELIMSLRWYISSEVHKFINYIWNNEEHLE
jgi:hypothetical protein